MTTNDQNDPATALTFRPTCSYDIGVLQDGMTEETPNARFISSGRYRAQTLLGSQLIEHGVHNVEEFFKLNPFGLPPKRPYTIYEVDPMSNERRYFGKGSVLPKSVPPPAPKPEPLGDDDDQEHEPARVIPLFEPEPRREDPMIRADRQMISALREELASRSEAVERSHRIAEQSMLQTDRMLDQIRETLDTMKDILRDKDETTKKLATTEAQVDAILKLREFEENIRKEREAEREQWRDRERQLQKDAEAKQQQGLGDLMESLTPFAPVIELILQRLLPPQNPYGEMPPGGMPPGMMPGMPPGGMPPGGIPRGNPGMGQRPMNGRMPPQGGPQGGMPGTMRPMAPDRPPQQPQPARNGTTTDETADIF